MSDSASETSPLLRQAGTLLLAIVLVAICIGSEPLWQEWLGRALWVATSAWALWAAWSSSAHAKKKTSLVMSLALIAFGMAPWVGLAATISWLIVLLALVTVSISMLISMGRLGAAVKAFRALAPALAVACIPMTSTALRCGAINNVNESQPWMALQGLAASDQLDRQSGCFALNPQRDVQRRVVALRVLTRNHAPPPHAAADAGLLFLHGSSTQDLALAYGLLRFAASSGDDAASKLERAALDRLRLAQGLPQIYGTQWIYRK